MDQIGLRLFQLLVRHPQVALAPALLLEQLGVAHGERRLGGKRFDQTDDLLGEFTRLAASDDETTKDILLVQQRRGDHRTVAPVGEGLDKFWQGDLPLGKEVADLRRRAGDRRGADGSFAVTDRRRPQLFDELRFCAVAAAEPEFPRRVVELIDHAGLGMGELDRPRHYGRQYAFEVEGRTDGPSDGSQCLELRQCLSQFHQRVAEERQGLRYRADLVPAGLGYRDIDITCVQARHRLC